MAPSIDDPGGVSREAASSPASASRKGAADSPTEALGRRILSTAFVRVGPDGYLTVEMRDGGTLILRDVVMRPKDFCGRRVSGASSETRYCGGYAGIVAARPGGAPLPSEPDVIGTKLTEPVRGSSSPR